MSPTCCVALPQAADVVMGVLTPRPCCPSDLPGDVSVRAMVDDDWDAVRRIYGEGIDTRNATFAAEVPPRVSISTNGGCRQHRWVATIGGVVVGWAALSPVSERDCYRGVVENSVYVADGMRGRGVGKALLRKQVMAADADGLWTLQTSMFPENRASILAPSFGRVSNGRPSREDRRTRRRVARHCSARASNGDRRGMSSGSG